ncbi:MAG TPA: DUF5134 domain-containing protein [Pseudonocardiaceae bacterium]|nr:DUF5134 domain-containing protein [Pseudonocardiaceae bacterium]
MVGSDLVRWVMTAMFAAVTVTCLLRLASTAGRADRPAGFPRRHEDLGHIVMAVSMLAMVLSWARVLPTAVWVALFGAQAVFFAVVLLGGRTRSLTGQENWDHTHHLVASVGMVYMVLALGGQMAAMTGSPVITASPLAGAFGLYMLGYAGWSGLRATRLGGAPAGWSGLPSVLARPLLVDGCRAVMGAGMAYLLLTA